MIADAGAFNKPEDAQHRDARGPAPGPRASGPRLRRVLVMLVVVALVAVVDVPRLSVVLVVIAFVQVVRSFRHHLPSPIQ